MGLTIRVKKIILLNYYEGGKCVCGHRKRKRHWSCRPCKDMMKDSLEAKTLTEACERHTNASASYVEGIKERLHYGLR